MRRGLFGLCLLLACAVSARPESPDVLLVVLDTVRADRLAAYGHDRPTSTSIERLAREGVLFEDVTAPGAWTWPSHASLFTGEPPWVHGAHLAHFEPERMAGETVEVEGIAATRVREDLPLLAERFAASGYRTVAISANAWLAPELGLMRGFETARVIEDDFAVTAAARELALRGREDDRPLFLFVNLMAAHAPYNLTPEPWAERHRAALTPERAPDWLRPYLWRGEPPGVHLNQRAPDQLASGVQRWLLGRLEIPPAGFALMLDLYDGEVALADRLFGEILDGWRAARPRGVVAVTSDHGELFGEHGLIEHRGSVYSELVRVPLVVSAPGRLPGGIRVATPVQLQALHDTLLELAGQDGGADSLIAVVSGAPGPSEIRAAAWPDAFWARLIGGRLRHRWHLLRVGDGALVESSGGGRELYDLAIDPAMTRDLARERPAQVDRFAGRAERLTAELGRGETPVVHVPAAARERLRALGYAVD